jgi:hypothetical protein
VTAAFKKEERVEELLAWAKAAGGRVEANGRGPVITLPDNLPNCRGLAELKRLAFADALPIRFEAMPHQEGTA